MALKYLRDNLKSLKWVLWGVVLTLVGFVFFSWGGVNRRQQGGIEVAATVGGEKITYSEFQREFQRMEGELRQAFGEQYDRDLVKQFNLPKRALDQLIDRRIRLMEARDIGLQVTNDEVRETILDLPVFTGENGRFVGTEKYRDLLRANRMSTEDFESSVRDDLLLQKLGRILAATTWVSDQAVEEAYRDQTERAKIRWVTLPASAFTEVEAAPEESEAWFEDHREEYEVPEQRVVDYLLVDTIKLRREIEIPEAELRAYYDDHQDEFTRDEQVRARHILFKVTPDRPDGQARQELAAVGRRIEAGEDFGPLAQELSEDEVSAARGGSLGFFGRGQMIPAFEEAAFAAEVGQLIGPLKTDFGYHLIEVQDHRQGGLQPFDQVSARVRSRILGERVDEIAIAKAQDVAQRLQAPAAEQPATEQDRMAEMAAEEDLTLQTTEPFGRNDNVSGIGRAPAFLEAAFKLEPEAISDPVKVPRGWVTLRLKEVIPPRLPELAEVEDEVRTAVEQAKRGSAALERLHQVKSSFTGGDFEALAAELDQEIQESAEFGRFGSVGTLGAQREIIDAALALEEGQWSEPVETDTGAVLFEVVERKVFDPGEFAEARETTRRNQEAQQVNQLLASTIELRRRDLNPTYSPRVFESFGIDLAPGGGSPGS